jgi:cytochrome c553
LRLAAGIAAVLLCGAAPPVLSGGSVAGRIAPCYVCHGAGGDSQTPQIPSIGGQPAFFVSAQLFLFRGERRGAAARGMVAAASTLSDDDLRAFGEYLSRLPPPAPPPGRPDTARMARGAALAGEHRCAACHNPDYSGREQMPRLAHQREDYLLKALRDYKSGARVPYGPGMEDVVSALTDKDFVDLAHYLAHWPAKGK